MSLDSTFTKVMFSPSDTDEGQTNELSIKVIDSSCGEGSIVKFTFKVIPNTPPYTNDAPFNSVLLTLG